MKQLYVMILGLVLSVSAMANTAFEQGMHYAKLRTEDGYRQAFGYFSQAAEQGDDKAQLMLGVMYDEGMGIQQDGIVKQ